MEAQRSGLIAILVDSVGMASVGSDTRPGTERSHLGVTMRRARHGAHLPGPRKKVRVENLAGTLEIQRRPRASWGAQYRGAGHTVVDARGCEFVVENWSPTNFDALEYFRGTHRPEARWLHSLMFGVTDHCNRVLDGSPSRHQPRKAVRNAGSLDH